ncbi:MAG: transglycosylase SLT domain-containing protein [Sphingomicrobium sp.]
MRVGLFALAALLSGQPAVVLAQDAADPLAPIADPAPATQPAPEPLVLYPPSFSTVRPSAPPAGKMVRAPVQVRNSQAINGEATADQALAVQPIIAPVQQPVRIPRDWREVFNAIRAGNWASASAGIAVLPQSVLTPLAKAELYTAKGSPVVDLSRLQALLAEAPDLPQAEQIARMAYTRGATSIPPIMPKRALTWLGSAPARYRARAVQGEVAADQLRAALDPLVKADAPADAELLLLQAAPSLSFEARAEAAQRVAWAYYVDGRDADARRVADTWRVGAQGEWATQAAWVSGLASWRLNDFEAASNAFRTVAGSAQERELSAAGYYWAARSEQACRRPASVEPLLRAAARSNESFYGLLARETLGMDTRLGPESHRFDASVENLPNVRRVEQLIAIGERPLAEELLRYQARIGRPSEHHGLIELAKRLDLAAAQFWLAHNGQPGAAADPRDRYPMPRWVPLTGWRVDPALAFAHILQESTFRTDAVSPAGAVGLMQVLPGTAQDMADVRSMPFSRASLTDPRYNLEFGQSFIEQMRRSSSTGGQLPRMMAAYNAGPLPVARWAWIPDKGDPLLWIESIPYWETRYYVPAVFRNMWVYQGLAQADMPTLSALAQHRAPAFPTNHTVLVQQASATTPATR